MHKLTLRTVFSWMIMALCTSISFKLIFLITYTLYIHCIYTNTPYAAATLINDEDFDYMGLVMKSIQEKTKQNRTMPGKLKRNHWTNKKDRGRIAVVCLTVHWPCNSVFILRCLQMGFYTQRFHFQIKQSLVLGKPVKRVSKRIFQAWSQSTQTTW